MAHLKDAALSTFAGLGMRKLGEGDWFNAEDLGLLCSLNCLFPWSSFFVFSVEGQQEEEEIPERENSILRSVSRDEFEEFEDEDRHSAHMTDDFFYNMPIEDSEPWKME
jgi:hypothetical protein